jgi:hypothetical protein
MAQLGCTLLLLLLLLLPLLLLLLRGVRWMAQVIYLRLLITLRR